MKVLGLLLGILEFLELLNTPLGLSISLWCGVYGVLIQFGSAESSLATVLAVIPATNLYFWLQQLEY